MLRAKVKGKRKKIILLEQPDFFRGSLTTGFNSKGDQNSKPQQTSRIFSFFAGEGRSLPAFLGQNISFFLPSFPTIPPSSNTAAFHPSRFPTPNPSRPTQLRWAPRPSPPRRCGSGPSRASRALCWLRPELWGRVGVSSTAMGSLLQCLTTLTVKTFFLISRVKKSIHNRLE